MGGVLTAFSFLSMGWYGRELIEVQQMHIYAVIMAGVSKTRLWPLSRVWHHKPFVALYRDAQAKKLLLESVICYCCH